MKMNQYKMNLFIKNIYHSRELRLLLEYGFLLLILSYIDIGGGADPQFWRKLSDAGHFPAFFLLQLFITNLLQKNAFRAFPIAVFIALIIELSQPYFSRSASLDDFYAGVFGVWCSFLCIQAYRSRRFSIIFFSFLLSFCLSAYLAKPACEQLIAMYHRSKIFPILLEPENTNTVLLWRPNGDRHKAASHIIREKFGLRITALVDGYPGIEYRAGDADWSKYENIFLRMHSAQEHTITVRIDDKFSGSEPLSRFSKTIELNRQDGEYRIPIEELKKRIDVTKVRRMIIFLPQGKVGDSFALSKAYLE